MSSRDGRLSDFPDGVEIEGDRTAVIKLRDLNPSLLPSSPDRHMLVRMDSASVGKLHTLEGPELRLGRHASCHVVLEDDGVSRRHARLVREGSHYVLEDLGSANGTFVAGNRIERQQLADGDVFQLGPNVLFRYTFTDASQERMMQQLYDASVKDALTGCYNREHFDERLRAEVAYANRHSTIVSLVLFDLDHFKQINDNYGHQAGDAVLVAVTRSVQHELRTEDLLARYGGEEFAVVLRGIDLRGAGALAERLRARVAAAPVVFEQHQIPVSMSLGCAGLTCCPEVSTKALVAIADRRLYAAKRGGRNRVVAEG
ncbi:MAG: GGDEF domain-containing protein [Polyangiaceae bacterium]